MSDERPPPPRVLAALQQVVGPARVLAAVARAGAWVAAVAGGLFWLEVLVRWRWWPGVVVLLVVIALPVWWLRHAAEVFADVAVLPERVGRRPELTVASRAQLRQLRHGGLGHAARTVRTTVREVGDLVGPVTSAVEVVAAPFWIATAGAAVGAALLVVLALTAGPLVVVLG